MSGAEKLAALKVVPYLLPLRPIIGTFLADAHPPVPERMFRLYRSVCETLQKYGVNPLKSKAGCVQCGACSALNDAFCYGLK